MHHLQKRMKLTGSDGKMVEGRAFDLICMRLAIMALKGDIKAFDKLIELAGGDQAVAFMMGDLYRSERLREDDPDPDDEPDPTTKEVLAHHRLPPARAVTKPKAALIVPNPTGLTTEAIAVAPPPRN